MKRYTLCGYEGKLLKGMLCGCACCVGYASVKHMCLLQCEGSRTITELNTILASRTQDSNEDSEITH